MDEEGIDVTELEKKFLHERELKGLYTVIVSIVAITFSTFHVVNGSFTGLLQHDIVKSVHLAFAIALSFLIFPLTKKRVEDKIPIYDFILALIGFYVAFYLAMNYREILFRAAIGFTPFDFLIAFLAVIFVLEATRRAINPALVVVAIVFILYAKFGSGLPGALSHPDYEWTEILEHLYYTKEGIFGTPIAVSSSFVVLFVIFGAFLEKSGAGRFFIDLAFSLTGWMVGGPAKAAVVSSALMGTISGSSVANTVTTGAFTIPLMKRAGYKPEFAGAVEPAASTGGQIMPPIMGAAAFIMAEFVGMPYISIVYAAIIPAFLYFFGVFSAVDFEARKENLRGLRREELPSPLQVLKGGWYYLIPLFIIIYMLVNGYTPILAAVYSIYTVIIIMVLEPILKNIRRPKDSRYPFSEVLKKSLLNILSALEHGGRSAATVAMACASAGIIVGVVTLTGLGFKIAASAIALSHGYLPIILLLTMVVSLVLGMGVPTTANYIITSTIAAPAIITFVAKGYGMSVIDFLEAYPELVLPAHMFVFYFGVAADLTPPVALAAYAGSAIAGSDPWKTGINAVKIGIGKYLVPYLFIFTPALLLIGVRTPVDVLNLLLIVISVMLGIMAINAGTIGCVLRPISRTLRVVSLGAGALLLIPDSMLKIVGFVIFAGIFLKQYYSLHDEVD